MKCYHGYRIITCGWDGTPITSKCVVSVTGAGGPNYLLPQRQDIRNHSPAGFEWGYGGSGPAQLALALVADCRGKEYAVPKIYQRVKRAVARFPRDGWTITERLVYSLVALAVKETGFVTDVCPNE